MILVSVSYAAGFTVRLERERADRGKPSVLHLIIKSSARFGSEEDWKEYLTLLPLEVRRGETVDPGLAYRLMLALGTQIRDIKLLTDGSLKLCTTDHEVIFISGIEDVWEESWALEELKEVTEESPRSIVCNASGKVGFI